jgi:hypothetical protein
MVQVSQKQIKEALLEIMEERPDYFKGLLKEVIEEKSKDKEAKRDAGIDEMIEEDFAEYESVFKRLA